MLKSEIVTGLDIGSGKVTCVIAAIDEEKQQVKVLGGAAVDSKGLKNGMVTSVEEAAYSIQRAVQEAEKKAGGAVCSGGVILGVRGAHLRSFDARGRHSIARADQTITEEDVIAVLDNSKAVRLDYGTEILHVVPQKFSLDCLPGVPNPVGMQGAVLEAETHMVLASTPALTNLVTAVSRAGFSLDEEPVYTLLALGELLISEDEKAIGALLLDLGGHGTSLAVYGDGAVRHTRELPVGGDHITKDLAHGLGATSACAQELKHKYGAVYTDLVDPARMITILKADRRSRKEVPAREMLDYVQPRVEELLELAGAELARVPGSLDLAAGAVLTGGGALLAGMPEAAAELLELQQARLAYPVQELLDCPEEYLEQPYLGAVSLCCYPHLKHWTADLLAGRRSGGGNLLAQAWAWIKELF